MLNNFLMLFPVVRKVTRKVLIAQWPSPAHPPARKPPISSSHRNSKIPALHLLVGLARLEVSRRPLTRSNRLHACIQLILVILEFNFFTDTFHYTLILQLIYFDSFRPKFYKIKKHSSIADFYPTLYSYTRPSIHILYTYFTIILIPLLLLKLS